MGDLRIAGPGGFHQFADLHAVMADPEGRVVTATYRVAPRSDRWGPTDRGLYTIELKGFQVAAKQRVPVTALLLIDDARSALAQERIHASLELFTPSDPEQVTIAGRAVPLEVEPTASLAFGLSNPEIWATELRGFVFGDLLRKDRLETGVLEPVT